jgi:hypothetical protein
MKLLISTYACAPDRGSDLAVGWELDDRGAQAGPSGLGALASTAHRHTIEAACREDSDLAGINWIFPEVAGWPLRAGIEPTWERTYNLLPACLASRQTTSKPRLRSSCTIPSVKAPVSIPIRALSPAYRRKAALICSGIEGH